MMVSFAWMPRGVAAKGIHINQNKQAACGSLAPLVCRAPITASLSPEEMDEVACTVTGSDKQYHPRHSLLPWDPSFLSVKVNHDCTLERRQVPSQKMSSSAPTSWWPVWPQSVSKACRRKLSCTLPPCQPALRGPGPEAAAVIQEKYTYNTAHHSGLALWGMLCSEFHCVSELRWLMIIDQSAVWVS